MTEYKVYIDRGIGLEPVTATRNQSLARLTYDAFVNTGLYDVFLFYSDRLYFLYIAHLE